jgi:PHD/YefM family antitoxin component YafN of YafNO toxin-antitoxin module
MTLHPKYITDDNGNKDAVILPIKEYNQLLEELEEMEDVRLYDEAKAANEPSIPIDEAFKIIEAERKK